MTVASIFPNKQHILSLPNEILVRIFTKVYYASCDIPLDDAPASKLADASLFPQCLANVCTAWKELVRSVPLFATHVMVFVDDEDEKLTREELQDRFQDSRSLLIKVFVVRKTYPEDPDPDEKAIVRKVVKALKPHITRCQVLVFDLLQNSSLPHMTEFSGKAAKLRTLRMQCRRTDGEDIQLVSRHALRTQPSPFLCPNLQYLDMHGHMFIEALRIPQWEQSIRALARKHITISHLRNVDPEEFDLRDLIRALSNLDHLTYLKLLDIELDCASCLANDSNERIHIQNFEFEGLSREFITGFAAAYDNKIDVSSLIIRDCGLGNIRHFASWYLTLENIDKSEDLTEFVSHWDGFNLSLKNCPGVDDTLVLKLATIYSKTWFYAPTLRQLEIEIPASARLSVEAFKVLVTARKAESEKYHPLLSSRPLPIRSLYIYGPGGEELSPEDKTWFKDNVECFIWDTTPQVALDVESPTIDDDLSSWDFSTLDESLIPHLSLPPLTQDSIESNAPSEDSSISLISGPPSSPELYPIADDYCGPEWTEEGSLL